MQLPYLQTNDKDLNRLQTQWKSILDPILALPILDGVLLKEIALINGATVVNHKLGRKPQGFIITDIDAGTQVYRSAPFNPLTLTLTAGAACTVSLWVY